MRCAEPQPAADIECVRGWVQLHNDRVSIDRFGWKRRGSDDGETGLGEGVLVQAAHVGDGRHYEHAPLYSAKRVVRPRCPLICEANDSRDCLIDDFAALMACALAG